MPEDYVITGGPHCGKSTIIKALQQRGFAVVPEAAREVIRLGHAYPWENNYSFQCYMMDMQRRLEAKFPGEPRFLDRALHDSIGYCKFWKNRIPLKVQEKLKRRTYADVFFLDPVGDYQGDAERKETQKQARDIARFVEEGYISAGFTPIRVPAFNCSKRTSIKKRLELILNHVRNRTQV